MTNTKTIIRDFSDLKGFKKLNRNGKLNLVEKAINTSRYEVVGFVNQSGKIKLKCRFHNRRDALGRWTCSRGR
jgi:hypothetical protein